MARNPDPVVTEIVRRYEASDGKVLARFDTDAQYEAWQAEQMAAGAVEQGMYLKYPDGRVVWLDFEKALECLRNPYQVETRDLQKARAMADVTGGVVLCEAGAFKVCCCIEETSRGLFNCQCRPAGYVEALAPSYDESQPENISKRPVRADAQVDLFGGA